MTNVDNGKHYGNNGNYGKSKIYQNGGNQIEIISNHTDNHRC